MMRILARVALVGVVAAMVGCSRKASTPEAAFDKFVAAAKSGDEGKIIACMDKKTGEAMRQLLDLTKDMKKDGENPIEEMKKELKDATPTYGKAKIDGDKATLEVKTGSDTDTMAFVKEDGEWKITIPELAGAVEMFKAFKAMGGALGGK